MSSTTPKETLMPKETLVMEHLVSLTYSEELTPVRGDLRAPLPIVVATAMLLARPAQWRRLASGSVADYALTPAGWQALLSAQPVAMPDPTFSAGA